VSYDEPRRAVSGASLKKQNQIICIYCRQARQPSREHVLQRALGGSFVARIACEDCNQRLSGIDQALAQHSVVALSRVSNTPKSAFKTSLGGEVFGEDPQSGLVLDMTLGNAMQAEILPQIHVLPSKDEKRRPVQIIAKDMQDHRRLDSFVRKAINDGTIMSTFVKEGPEEASTTRFVLYRKDQAYVRVPPGAREEATSLLRMIEKGWHKAGFSDRLEESINPQTIVQPQVTVRMAICLDDVYRAVAKIAFNVMAAEFGAGFALRSEFDEIRAYILGDDIRHPEQLADDQIDVDNRFVRQDTDRTCFVATDEHAVTLAPHSGSLFAWVTLYGTHQYGVSLGEVPLSDFVISTIEFSTTRKGHRKLELTEILQRVIQARREGHSESSPPPETRPRR
jgi:hypothetical protein